MANQPADATDFNMNEEDMETTKAQLHLHRQQLMYLLAAAISPGFIQVLLLLKVLTKDEYNVLMRKQKPRQKASALIDIVSRKGHTVLKKFLEVLETHCPRAHHLLRDTSAFQDTLQESAETLEVPPSPSFIIGSTDGIHTNPAPPENGSTDGIHTNPAPPENGSTDGIHTNPAPPENGSTDGIHTNPAPPENGSTDGIHTNPAPPENGSTDGIHTNPAPPENGSTDGIHTNPAPPEKVNIEPIPADVLGNQAAVHGACSTYRTLETIEAQPPSEELVRMAEGSSSARQLTEALINTTDEHGRNPLHKAADTGNEEAMKNLVSAIPKKGDPEVMKYMGGNSETIESRDDAGRTPLHLAARGGHLEVIKILMDKGVDVNIKDNGNHTPRDLATASGCQATVLEALTPSQAGRGVSSMGVQPLTLINSTDSEDCEANGATSEPLLVMEPVPATTSVHTQTTGHNQETIREWMICCICFRRMQTPVALPCCAGIRCCRACWDRWTVDHENCPYCGTRGVRERAYIVPGLDPLLEALQEMMPSND